MVGVKFGNYHSFDDFGLILIKTEHGNAPQKTNYIDVLGADGTLDCSTSLTDGDMKFGDRTIKYTFETKARVQKHDTLGSLIRNAIDGQKLYIIEDRNPAYKWNGRPSVSPITANGAGGTLTIECVVNPYKSEIQEYNDWLWDSFNFDTGVIRDYQGLVAGTYQLGLGSRRKSALKVQVTSGTLQIISNSDNEVIWSGSIANGTQTIPSIVIENGTELIFRGTDDLVFNVIFEGGSL